MADLGKVHGKYTLPNTVQLVVGWQAANGKAVHNVLYGIVGSGFTPTPAIAEAIRSAWTSSTAFVAFLPFQSSQTLFQTVGLRDFRTIDNPVILSTGTQFNGGGAGGALPYGSSYVITQRTAFTGQHARGRIYIPCLDRSLLSANGTIIPANLTILQNMAIALQTAMNASGLTLALAQPPRAGYTNPKTGTVHPPRGTLPSSAGPGVGVASLQVESLLARQNFLNSQRRRAQV